MQKAVDSIKIYLENHPEISQNKLAKMAGVTGGALSAFLKGNYTGRSEGLKNKLLAVINAASTREKAVTEVREPEIVETTIMRQMFFSLDYAQDRNDIVLIYGAPGIGKTVTARKWLRENPNAVFFTASPNLGSKRAVMEEMLGALNKRPEGRCDKLQRTLIGTLRASNRPILIDEAHFLRLESLETLRCLHDETGCPIILVGNPTIMEKITERNRNVTGQFFSRAVRMELDGNISIDDVKSIVLQHDVELGDECLTELHRAANGTGAYRVMTKMFLFALTMAFRADEPVSIEHILAAKKVIINV